MFDALHRLLTGLDHPHRAAEQNDSAFALAVLLIEVARSSADRVEDREEGVIERALTRRFGFEQTEVIRLVKAAEEGAIQATDLFHFTQVVVNNFGDEERIGVIEMLWEVAYADGVLTGDEDTLIRRVAGLIDVSDRDRGTRSGGQGSGCKAIQPDRSHMETRELALLRFVPKLAS